MLNMFKICPLYATFVVEISFQFIFALSESILYYQSVWTIAKHQSQLTKQMH